VVLYFSDYRVYRDLRLISPPWMVDFAPCSSSLKPTFLKQAILAAEIVLQE